jgi:hypothetical protein
VNVAAWRRDDVAARALVYLQRYRDRVFFMDQEALNAVLAGQWRHLDPRWNWSATRDRLTPARRASDDSARPWILHFSGNLKPWTYRSRGANHALYFRYLDLTAWRGRRPRGGLRSAILSSYESCGVRRVLYPAEQQGIQIVRRITRRFAAANQHRPEDG